MLINIKNQASIKIFILLIKNNSKNSLITGGGVAENLPLPGQLQILKPALTGYAGGFGMRKKVGKKQL